MRTHVMINVWREKESKEETFLFFFLLLILHKGIPQRIVQWLYGTLKRRRQIYRVNEGPRDGGGREELRWIFTHARVHAKARFPFAISG